MGHALEGIGFSSILSKAHTYASGVGLGPSTRKNGGVWVKQQLLVHKVSL